MLPSRVAVSERAYAQAIQEADGLQKFCWRCDLTMGRCQCHFRAYKYEQSASTPRSMVHHCFHGPGMQCHYPTEELYSGYPGPHSKTLSRSLPYRCSTSKEVSEVPDATPEHYPEMLPDYQNFTAKLPLGKQLAGDPLDVRVRCQEEYEKNVVSMTHYGGGPSGYRNLQIDTLRSQKDKIFEGPPGGEVPKVTKDSKYPVVQTGGPWPGNWDGDIPAWTPKRYEGVAPVRPAFVVAGKEERGGDTGTTYKRDIRVCAPARETLTHNVMSSFLGAGVRPRALSNRADLHSYLNCHTQNTPSQIRSGDRSISLPRGAPLSFHPARMGVSAY